MLQLIGWLGCLYLVVKALEIASNPAFKNSDGKMTNIAMAAAVIAWFGAIGFALAFNLQGSAFPSAGMPTMHDQSSCMEKARTVDEITACADAAS